MRVLLNVQVCVSNSSVSSVCAPSLAVHPDRVRVASGQAAGVDKDGKVSEGLGPVKDEL